VSRYRRLPFTRRRGRILVPECEDNLIRGASGRAVRNFNRMYGHPETTALMI